MSQINSTKKVRVLIVDDSSFMRMAIRGILDRDPDLEVIGSAIDGADGAAGHLYCSRINQRCNAVMTRIMAKSSMETAEA